MNIQYGTTTISYKVARKKRLKNTYISVGRSGVLVKTSEPTTADEIEAFVRQKARWIVENLKGYVAACDDDIATGSRLYYLGKSYYVELTSRDIDSVMVEFIYSKFKIKAPLNASQRDIHLAIDLFYKVKAKKKISALVSKWSKQMRVEPAHISFKKAQKRWGSCSPTNRLSFNYDLMKFSTALIEYAVIHELTHIKHKNHGKAFWACVKRVMPDYQLKVEAIKAFEKRL